MLSNRQFGSGMGQSMRFRPTGFGQSLRGSVSLNKNSASAFNRQMGAQIRQMPTTPKPSGMIGRM